MPFKETKDGQTHSFGDGCGEPEHNTPCHIETPQECAIPNVPSFPLEDWREEFDDLFVRVGGDVLAFAGDFIKKQSVVMEEPETLKSFISTLLAKQREEVIEVAEEIEEKVEGAINNLSKE